MKRSTSNSQVAAARGAIALLLVGSLLAPTSASAIKRDASQRSQRRAAVAWQAPAEIVVHPVDVAPGIAPLLPPEPASDPQLRELADALAAFVPAARARARATQPVVVAGAQRDSLDRLEANRDDRVRVRLTPRRRVPRFVEGKRLARAAARSLGARRAEATARGFLRENRKLLRLADPDGELQLRREDRDALGQTHLRFAQRHRGLRVEPAEVLVHLDRNGDVDLMNGTYAETPADLDVVPELSSADAIARARDAVDGGAFAEVPDPSLLIWSASDAPPALAWDVRVPVSLAKQWRVLVDAHAGSVITAYNLAMEVDVVGSGVDGFGANQPIHVWQEGGAHFLVDTSKPMYDPSSDPPNPNTTRGAIIITDAVNQPPNDNPQTLPPVFNLSSTSPNGPWRPQGTTTGPNVADGVSALVNFARVDDYFRTVHARNSLDGQGGSILAIVRLGANFQNAFFLHESNLMAFGDALNYAGALDVVAHELTHGITHHTANLVYQNESGAINEAMSDIFGEMVEARVKGTAPDWLVGSPPALATPLRNMQDPSSLNIGGGFGPYPEKYSQRIQTTQDNGGVHLNSSILNHAFFQLVQGLPGALTRSQGERIFYRALTTYLTANAQFVDARLACVRAAEDLFGAGSAPVQRVKQAFDFVEIFDGAGATDPDPFPGTVGTDATLFLRLEPVVSGSAPFLTRREPPVDGPAGATISRFDVGVNRPAVTGDGELAYFVDSIADICTIDTAGGAEEDCLGFPGLISSVSVSPDGQVFGFVLRDSNTGQARNEISVIDLSKPPGQGDAVTFALRAPALDGGSIATVLYADAMDITADNRFVVYDALNRIALAGGGYVEVWSIYRLDRETGNEFAVVPPTLGLDIGYPALAQSSDNYMVFDVLDDETGASIIYAANLNQGDEIAVGENPDGFGVPSYTGNDGAVVFSIADVSAATGSKLVSRPLQNRFTPTGSQQTWAENADFGVVYRRGSFVPEPSETGLGGIAIAALALLARRRRAAAR